jgi:carbon monoxide dehydrogenase subunit G
VRASATLKPAGTGTKVTLTAQGEPGGMFKLAEGVLAKQVKSQMEDNLKRLKSVLESGAQ